MGKVGQLAAKGERTAEKAFYDKTGALTDDPKAVRDGGGMLPWGQQLTGHKGYAFAFWCEALTAMAGGWCNDPSREQRQSFNLTVIDPEAFAGLDYYRREMERFVGWVRSSRPAPGVDKVRLPGERMFQHIAESKKTGVELSQGLFDRLNETAAKNGLKPLKTV